MIIINKLRCHRVARKSAYNETVFVSRKQMSVILC